MSNQINMVASAPPARETHVEHIELFKDNGKIIIETMGALGWAIKNDNIKLVKLFSEHGFIINQYHLKIAITES